MKIKKDVFAFDMIMILFGVIGWIVAVDKSDMSLAIFSSLGFVFGFGNLIFTNEWYEKLKEKNNA